MLQDPAEWVLGVRKAVALALEHCDPERIGGIAVSGQQHGLVALDAEDQVLVSFYSIDSFGATAIPAPV